jgi:predicted dehydrogenase
MLDAAKKNNVKLMIGQCQRFGTEWSYVKDVITSGALGAPYGGFFYRNGGGIHEGGAPTGFNGWYRCREKGGGGLFDQHIHDIDNINYFFGVPKAVSTVGKRVYTGSGYDICSTNYIYDEDWAVHTENTWSSFEPGFREGFRADFEEGTIIVDRLGFRAYQKDKGEIEVPKLIPGHSEHYNEIKYFADIVANNKENTINPPESSKETIRIALAEMKSADLKGELVYLGDIK